MSDLQNEYARMHPLRWCVDEHGRYSADYVDYLEAELCTYKSLLNRAKKDDLCRDDEEHCTCVPWLRAGIHALQAELKNERKRAYELIIKACDGNPYIDVSAIPTYEQAQERGEKE